ncbi:sulfatase [Candidatus Poribacteria bacterium]
MNRREFLRQSGVALGSLALLRSSQYAEAVVTERPDVLFIAIEDISPVMGCYGNPVVRTPNIDAFASRGVRFDSTQCQFPVCNPSRASMLSGLRPRTNGVMGNATDWNERLKPGTTMPEYFRSNGYETATVGKIFHRGNSGRVYDSTARWSRIIPENADLPRRSMKRKIPPQYLYDHLVKEEREKSYHTRAWHWGPLACDDIDTSDGRIAEQAVRVLSKPRQEGDKPLFFAVGFHKTHLPLRAPEKYFDMYPPEEMPLPDYPKDDLDDVPKRYSLQNHKAFTDKKRREAIAAFYACTTFIDTQVGKVLDALKQSGRDKNTIVVIWGDHGFHLGQHMLWQKMTLFEESCRVPLIIYAPEVTKPGGVCNRPTESIDLYPTLAELCDLDTPEDLEAISMVPLLRDPGHSWKKAAFTYHGSGVSIRTQRWRYNEWRSPEKAELYDHESDPKEIKNLAGDPKYISTVRELSALIKSGWQAALPVK